jgi:hypothetical protein
MTRARGWRRAGYTNHALTLCLCRGNILLFGPVYLDGLWGGRREDTGREGIYLVVYAGEMAMGMGKGKCLEG